MSLLSWFDYRTLYGCQCMLSIMFAALFLWMGRAYPMVRGIRSITGAFLLGIPGTFLLMSRGHISDFWSQAVANLLSGICLILLYDGIVTFLHGRPRIWLVTGWLAVSLMLVYSWTTVRLDPALRNLVMGVFYTLLRCLMAWELLRRSSEPSAGTRKRAVNRTSTWRAMQVFGVFLAMLAGVGLIRVVMPVVPEIARYFPESNAARNSTLLLNGAFLGLYGLCFFAMACEEMILRVQEESERDLLSGAFNRRGIERRLATELKRSDRSRQRLSVALVDIDHFKMVNDRHGHAAGDEAICAVSVALASSLRDSDYLGRYGGDEFLVILPMTASGQAEIAAERLRRAVSEVNLQAGKLQLTLSIGLTEASPEDDAISLIARADEALYRAKSDGRNCLRRVLPLHTYADAPATQTARTATES